MNMTDNEIIKALECCDYYKCFSCPLRRDNNCLYNLRNYAIDIINRQKAEIERLNAELEDKQFRCDSCDRIGLTRSEHIVCIKRIVLPNTLHLINKEKNSF